VVCVLAHRNRKRRGYPSRSKESHFSVRSVAVERRGPSRLQRHAALRMESRSSYYDQRLPWAADYRARAPAAQNFVPEGGDGLPLRGYLRLGGETLLLGPLHE
jgi:hypothetical protein